MKKIILLILITLSLNTIAQTYTHNSKVRVKQADTAADTDNLVTIDANGNLKKTTQTVDDLITVLPTGLEEVTEDSKTGWRFISADENYYANIGNYAVDLSQNPFFPSSIFGAKGDYSFATGLVNQAIGDASSVFGVSNSADSYVEAVFGVFSTTYTPNSTTSFDSADRLFNVGNGISDTSRSDALTIMKNGSITAPSLDISEITDDKSLTTKEWVEDNINTDEWETHTGSTQNGDLNLTIGDVLDNGNGTIININDTVNQINYTSDSHNFMGGGVFTSLTSSEIDTELNNVLVSKEWVNDNIPDTSSLVPYTGATQNLQLGTNSLISNTVSTTGSVNSGNRLSTLGNALDFLESGNSGSTTLEADIVGTNIITIPSSTGTMALLSDIPSISTLYAPSLIWAEEAQAISTTQLPDDSVFSYGNGAVGDIGIISYVSGQKISGMIADTENLGTTMTVSISINGVAQSGYEIVIDSNTETVEFTTPLDLTIGDKILFYVSSVTGTFSNVRVGAVIQSPLKQY